MRDPVLSREAREHWQGLSMVERMLLRRVFFASKQLCADFDHDVIAYAYSRWCALVSIRDANRVRKVKP